MQAAQLCEACGVGLHKNECLHCGEALAGGAIVGATVLQLLQRR